LIITVKPKFHLLTGTKTTAILPHDLFLVERFFPQPIKMSNKKAIPSVCKKITFLVCKGQGITSRLFKCGIFSGEPDIIKDDIA